MKPQFDVPVSRLFFVLCEMTKHIRIFEGATRSTKTVTIVIWLIFYALTHKKAVIRVFRAVKADCRDSVCFDFLKMMGMYFPQFSMDNWNKSSLTFTFPTTGTIINFAGCENAGRLHGYGQDIAYVNEIMSVKREPFYQIVKRTTKLLLIDFNPSVSQHYIFEEYIDTKRTDFDYCHSTFKDNDFLSDFQKSTILGWEPTKENIEKKTADPRRWSVYGLGQRAEIDGQIYTNWEKTKWFPEREACSHWIYGIDFGFTRDPTAIILVAYCQGVLYIKELCYEKNLHTAQNKNYPNEPCIENYLVENKVGKKDLIVCDKARPEQRKELTMLGYNAVRSFGNRIEDGIDRVKKYTLHPDAGSVNLLGELENYRLKPTIQNDRMLDKPVDEFNHCLDALRYVVEYLDYLIKTNSSTLVGDTLEKVFMGKFNRRRRRLYGART